MVDTYECMYVMIAGDAWKVEKTTDLIDPRLKDIDGYCDLTSNSIAVETVYDDILHGVDFEQVFIDESLRHELIHAWLKATGAKPAWDEDEDLVFWLARMIPKIAQTMIDVGAMKLDRYAREDKPLDGDTNKSIKEGEKE